MQDWIGILLLAVVVLGIIGLIVSVYIGKTHQKSYKDQEASPSATRHRVLGNPISMLNILFPIITFIGAALFYFYYLAR